MRLPWIREWTDEERDQQSSRSKRLGLRPLNRWAEGGWTPEQVAMLGTDHDEVIAKKVGKTTNAVTRRRTREGIAAHRDRRRR